MSSRLITALFVLVGLINLYPVVGVLSAEQLGALYGLDFNEDNLLLLMRHRALLLGLLGAFMLYAAFRPRLQPLAFGAGFISMLSFLLIARQATSTNALIHKVVLADIVASLLLALAAALFLNGRAKR